MFKTDGTVKNTIDVLTELQKSKMRGDKKGVLIKKTILELLSHQNDKFFIASPENFQILFTFLVFCFRNIRFTSKELMKLLSVIFRLLERNNDKINLLIVDVIESIYSVFFFHRNVLLKNEKKKYYESEIFEFLVDLLSQFQSFIFLDKNKKKFEISVEFLPEIMKELNLSVLLIRIKSWENFIFFLFSVILRLITNNNYKWSLQEAQLRLREILSVYLKFGNKEMKKKSLQIINETLKCLVTIPRTSEICEICIKIINRLAFEEFPSFRDKEFDDILSVFLKEIYIPPQLQTKFKNVICYSLKWNLCNTKSSNLQSTFLEYINDIMREDENSICYLCEIIEFISESFKEKEKYFERKKNGWFDNICTSFSFLFKVKRNLKRKCVFQEENIKDRAKLRRKTGSEINDFVETKRNTEEENDSYSYDGNVKEKKKFQEIENFFGRNLCYNNSNLVVYEKLLVFIQDNLNFQQIMSLMKILYSTVPALPSGNFHYYEAILYLVGKFMNGFEKLFQNIQQNTELITFSFDLIEDLIDGQIIKCFGLNDVKIIFKLLEDYFSKKLPHCHSKDNLVQQCFQIIGKFNSSNCGEVEVELEKDKIMKILIDKELYMKCDFELTKNFNLFIHLGNEEKETKVNSFDELLVLLLQTYKDIYLKTAVLINPQKKKIEKEFEEGMKYQKNILQGIENLLENGEIKNSNKTKLHSLFFELLELNFNQKCKQNGDVSLKFFQIIPIFVKKFEQTDFTDDNVKFLTYTFLSKLRDFTIEKNKTCEVEKGEKRYSFFESILFPFLLDFFKSRIDFDSILNYLKQKMVEELKNNLKRGRYVCTLIKCMCTMGLIIGEESGSEEKVRGIFFQILMYYIKGESFFHYDVISTTYHCAKEFLEKFENRFLMKKKDKMKMIEENLQKTTVLKNLIKICFNLEVEYFFETQIHNFLPYFIINKKIEVIEEILKFAGMTKKKVRELLMNPEKDYGYEDYEDDLVLPKTIFNFVTGSSNVDELNDHLHELMEIIEVDEKDFNFTFFERAATTFYLFLRKKSDLKNIKLFLYRFYTSQNISHDTAMSNVGEHLYKYLGNHFHHILSIFSRTISKNNYNETTFNKFERELEGFLYFIEVHCHSQSTKFKNDLPNIITTFQKAMGKFENIEKYDQKKNSFLDTIIDKFFVFLKILNKENLLGDHFYEVIFTILKNLKFHKDKVEEIINFIIMDNSKKYKEFFKEDFLQLLPDDAYASFKKNHQKVKKINFIENLKEIMKSYENKSIVVRRHLLEKMQLLCENNTKERQDMVLNISNVNFLNELVAFLLDRVSEDDINLEINELALTCLGFLGAIDPSIISLPSLYGSGKLLGNVDLIKKILKEFFGDYNLNKHAQFLACVLMKSLDNNDLVDLPENIRSYQSGNFSMPYVQDKKVVTGKKTVFNPSMRKLEWFKLWSQKIVENWNDKEGERSTKTNFNRKTVFEKLCGTINHLKEELSSFIIPYLLYYAISIEERNENHQENILKLALNEIHSIMNLVLQISQNSNNDYNNNITSAAEEVFSIIDQLTIWSENILNDFLAKERKRVGGEKERRRVSKSKRSPKVNFAFFGKNLPRIKALKVKEFLGCINFFLLSKSANLLNSPSRSLLYYEKHLNIRKLKANKEGKEFVVTKEDVLFLGQIYKNLNEKELCLAGLTSLRQNFYLSEEEKLIELESDRNWSAKFVTTEMLGHFNKVTGFDPNIERLDAIKSSGNFVALLEIVRSLLFENKGERDEYKLFGIKAAWRLGEWDILSEFLHDYVQDFETDLSKCILSFKQKNWGLFKSCVSEGRQNLLNICAWGAKQSYKKCYPTLCKLQILSEIESCAKLIKENRKNEIFEQLQRNFEISSIGSSLEMKETFLLFRKAIFSIVGGMDKEIGKTYLELAKLSRKEKNFDFSLSCQAQANFYFNDDGKSTFKEQARLFWDRGSIKNKLKAIEILKKHLHLLSIQDSKKSRVRKKGKLELTSRLLLLRWQESTKQKKIKDLYNSYETLTKEEDYKNVEESYFCYARCLDNFLVNSVENCRKLVLERKLNENDFVESEENLIIELYLLHFENVVKNYIMSLEHGSKHIYVSLPRFITICCEHGEFLERHRTVKVRHPLSHKYVKPYDEFKKKMNSIYKVNVKSIPISKFFTVASIVFSRITLSNLTMKQIMWRITLKLIKKFPNRTLWLFLSKSRRPLKKTSRIPEIVKDRIKSAKDILNNATSHENVIEEAKNVFEQLRKLSVAQYWIGDPVKTKNSGEKAFYKYFRQNRFQLVVPTFKNLSVVLPPDQNSHEPFFQTCQVIDSIGKGFQYFASQQKPKKFSFISTSGENINFIIKPGDDGRKDARFMEFFSMINLLLKKGNETRSKNLYIKTFAVVIINSDCTLVEWVENSMTIREVLEIEASKDKNEVVDFLELTSACAKRIFRKPPYKFHRVKLKEIYKIMKKKFNDKILLNWYTANFVESIKWFECRLNFTKLYAVMSMVGYIIGLGDRHLENVLVDIKTGSIVHIDFAKTFDLGKLLGYPEIVPFRLTRNLVGAMGITGVEGVFKKICEKTFDILKINKDCLLSILTPFVNDPLLDFISIPSSNEEAKKRKHRNHSKKGGDMEYKGKAVESIKAIQSKLRGFPEEWNFSNPSNEKDGTVYKVVLKSTVSTTGHVEMLIKEATSEKNLALMYYFWAPFM